MKKLVFASCERMLSARIASLVSVLADLRESAASETKSTAGDKYETALAMLQMEQKNVSGQLEVLRGQMAVLQSLATVGVSAVIIPGSLVLMNGSWYYLSVALGKIAVGAVSVIVLSASSPLGRAMLGRKVGEEFVFLGRGYVIDEVE